MWEEVIEVNRKFLAVSAVSLVLALLLPAAYALIGVGTLAPDFTRSDIHGNSYTLSAQTGKVRLLEWFFTT